jgi:tetratricopeptide (TPR) repeat protein
VWRLVVVYAASGDFEEAERVIDTYVSRGGLQGWAEFNRGVIERYRGHSQLAIAHYRNALRTFPNSRQVLIALAFVYHDLGQYSLAKPLVSRENPLLQAYMENSPDAARLARDAPVSAWFGDDLDTVVEILALQQDWRGLARFYDKPGAPRERACRIPLAAGRLAFALRQVGRSSDSTWLISCSKRAIAAQQQGPYRNEFWPSGAVQAAKAQMFALEGNWEAAFAELRAAETKGFRTPGGVGLRYLPAFAPVRATSAYSKAENELETLLRR